MKQKRRICARSSCSAGFSPEVNILTLAAYEQAQRALRGECEPNSRTKWVRTNINNKVSENKARCVRWVLVLASFDKMKKTVKKRSFWSKRRDLNPRSPVPETGAIPPSLRLEFASWKLSAKQNFHKIAYLFYHIITGLSSIFAENSSDFLDFLNFYLYIKKSIKIIYWLGFRFNGIMMILSVY